MLSNNTAAGTRAFPVAHIRDLPSVAIGLNMAANELDRIDNRPASHAPGATNTNSVQAWRDWQHYTHQRAITPQLSQFKLGGMVLGAAVGAGPMVGIGLGVGLPWFTRQWHACQTAFCEKHNADFGGTVNACLDQINRIVATSKGFCNFSTPPICVPFDVRCEWSGTIFAAVFTPVAAVTAGLVLGFVGMRLGERIGCRYLSKRLPEDNALSEGDAQRMLGRALSAATVRGALDDVKQLMHLGADPFSQDVKGISALDLSRTAGQRFVTRFFEGEAKS